MITKDKQTLPDVFFAKMKEKTTFALNGFKRVEQNIGNFYSQQVDIHLKDNVRIHYLCISSKDIPKKIYFPEIGTIIHASKSDEFGILLRADRESRKFTIWLPTAPRLFSFDEHRRVVPSDETSFSCEWEIYPHLQLNVLQSGQSVFTIAIPYLVLEDPSGQLHDELKSTNAVEKRLYRKTDWFFCNTPLDVWNYLIDGSIYHPQFETIRTVGKRFKCQQCAFAWWSYFGFLYKETQKRIYAIMQDEIAYSILLDMTEEGEWGHGFWSDEIETHTRFHLDGIHLLVSQYEKTGESIWLETAERGMGFVFDHLMEKLDGGSIWFLHDTTEHERRHKFKSTIFGKTPGNLLCINTHVQVLSVLYRLHKILPDKVIYAEMFEKGIKALQEIFNHKPGEFTYKLLVFWITKLLTRSRHSNWNRLRNYIESLIIPKFYWQVRRIFPRIVLPGGFIERDLNLNFFMHSYNIINLKDLLILYQQVPFNWLRPYIKNGLEFERRFFNKLDITNALTRSPFFIEYIDILHLYNKLIEHVPPDEMESIEKKIYQKTGGYSLDYYASEFVRGISN